MMSQKISLWFLARQIAGRAALGRGTDGFTARYYSKDQLGDLFNIFFDKVSVESFGQDADAAPLPRRLRPIVLNLMGAARASRIGNKRGGFLFVTASKQTHDEN